MVITTLTIISAGTVLATSALAQNTGRAGN
jgi:hypothetical protein